MADEATRKIDPEQPTDGESEVEAQDVDQAADDADESSEETIDLEAEVTKLQEALLRTHAEMENMRKRSEREVEKSRRFALERCIKDLVPVIDSLDQALANGNTEEGTDEVPEGMQLVHKQLLGALERHGLAVLDPVDLPFDPNWHEAMTLQPAEGVAPNTVLQVLQKGFKLHDRLLRPARVIVSRSSD